MEKENKPFVSSACPYAFFVIYYRNGNKLVEDRTDGLSWEKAEKRNIAAVGIQHDPLPLEYKTPDGVILRFAMDDNILKGSSRFEYQFFMFKKKIHQSNVKGTGTWKSFTVGMVVDSAGHCVVMEAFAGGRIRTYYTSLRSLGFVDQASINKQGISGTVTQIWKEVLVEGKKSKKLVEIKYDIDKCGLIRNPTTICRACGIDWFIWKEHPQHDCITAIEIKWEDKQRKLAEEVEKRLKSEKDET